ncbi:hypothetical protein K438DRAFT_1965196 [Mycena galopus ATCC 62051]|nr:hypothetical protein K438DRAFT_1965196 [Mycena galopus ATCC 62051]
MHPLRSSPTLFHGPEDDSSDVLAIRFRLRHAELPALLWQTGGFRAYFSPTLYRRCQMCLFPEGYVAAAFKFCGSSLQAAFLGSPLVRPRTRLPRVPPTHVLCPLRRLPWLSSFSSVYSAYGGPTLPSWSSERRHRPYCSPTAAISAHRVYALSSLPSVVFSLERRIRPLRTPQATRHCPYSLHDIPVPHLACCASSPPVPTPFADAVLAHPHHSTLWHIRYSSPAATPTPIPGLAFVPLYDACDCGHCYTLRPPHSCSLRRHIDICMARLPYFAHVLHHLPLSLVPLDHPRRPYSCTAL